MSSTTVSQTPISSTNIRGIQAHVNFTHNRMCMITARHLTIAIGFFNSFIAFSVLCYAIVHLRHPELTCPLKLSGYLGSGIDLRRILLGIAFVSYSQWMFSMLLVIGALNGEPYFLLAWLYSTPIVIFAYLIGIMTSMANYIGPNQLNYIITQGLICVVVSVILAVQLIIIQSYYSQLRSQAR